MSIIVSNGIFDGISDQYWAQKDLLTEVLNQHAPLKERTIKEDQLLYMTSELIREMYKRNTLKTKYLKNTANPIKWLLYRQQRNRITSLRCKAIRFFFLSKCKPGATRKDFWYDVGPFTSTKSKCHRNIILKEDENIITDTGELCEIFIKFFSTVANSIGSTDHIDMSRTDFYSVCKA